MFYSHLQIQAYSLYTGGKAITITPSKNIRYFIFSGVNKTVFVFLVMNININIHNSQYEYIRISIDNDHDF